MKTTILIFLILIVNITVLKSQTEDKQSGFYDLKISYLHSSKGQPGDYNNNYQTKIPLGIGTSCAFKFNKRLYTELGISFKTEKEKIAEGIMKGIYGPDIYFYYRYKNRYIDIPLQLNYNFFNYKFIDLYGIAGLKGSMCINKYYSKSSPNGDEYFDTRKEYGMAYNFGLMEYINLTKKISAFSTQNYGRYLRKYVKSNIFMHDSGLNWQTFEVKIGLAYKL